MFLVSSKYFERLCCNDAEDMEACNGIRNALKLKEANPYDRWVKFREVQGPLLILVQKRRRPIIFPIYGREAVETASRPTHVEMRVPTHLADVDAVRDCVMPEYEEIARFDYTHF